MDYEAAEEINNDRWRYASSSAELRWALANWGRIPLNPTDEERKTFDGAHDGMKQGWTGTMDQLADYLAKTKPGAI